jgi:hypothetical protein
LTAEAKKAASRAGNYQDAATASLDRDVDNDATTQDDDDEDQNNQSKNILSSVDKVIPYLTCVTCCSFGLTFMITVASENCPCRPIKPPEKATMD